MSIRSFARQWQVRDDDRHLGTIGRVDNGYTAFYRNEKSHQFSTRAEAVAWIVARDAVQLEVTR